MKGISGSPTSRSPLQASLLRHNAVSGASTTASVRSSASSLSALRGLGSSRPTPHISATPFDVTGLGLGPAGYTALQQQQQQQQPSFPPAPQHAAPGISHQNQFMLSAGAASNAGGHLSQAMQGTFTNLPDVVKTTFKALHDVVVAQGETIRRLERVVADKADWSEVEASLSARATVADVNKSLVELTQIVDRKADANATQDNVDQRAKREDVENMFSRILELVQQGERERSRMQTALDALADSNANKADVDALGKFVTRLDGDATKARLEDAERFTQTNLYTKAEIDERLKAFARREDVEAGLQTRAGINEVNEALQSKADVTQVIQALEPKADTAYVDSQWKELSGALLDLEDRVASHAMKTKMDDTLAAPDVRDLMQLLEQKANAEDVEVLLAQKADRMELTEALRPKVNASDLDNRLRANAEMIATEVQRALLTSQQEVVRVLNKKAYKTDVARSLQGKANLDEVTAQLERKANVTEMRESLSLKADLSAVQRSLEKKVDRDQYRMLEEQIRTLSTSVIRRGGHGGAQGALSEFDELRNDLLKRLKDKADTRHVTTLLDQKANVAEMSEALSTYKEKLDGAVSVEKLDSLLAEYRTMANHVSAEMMVGRWIWKSGRLNKGKTIPWNVQCVNTNHNNFIWTADTESIRTIVPGLYELKVGIFTDRDPRISITLNHKVILSSELSSHSSGAPGLGSTLRSGVPHSGDSDGHGAGGRRSARGILRHGNHPAGNVTGWTLVDFVAMPARAVITVTYAGGADAQGFLSLRKL